MSNYSVLRKAIKNERKRCEQKAIEAIDSFIATPTSLKARYARAVAKNIRTGVGNVMEEDIDYCSNCKGTGITHRRKV